MRIRTARSARLLSIVAVLLAAWLPAFAAERAMMLPVDPAPLVIETASGPQSFTIEIADDAGERSRGLMFRRTMDAGHGMLFVFAAEGPVAFWMENTSLPLDLLFISGRGEVRAILSGKPFSRAPIDPGEPVRFVLEINAGIAAARGIAPGDRVHHPRIDAVAIGGSRGG